MKTAMKVAIGLLLAIALHAQVTIFPNNYFTSLTISGTGPGTITMLTGSGANAVTFVPTTSGGTNTLTLPDNTGTLISSSTYQGYTLQFATTGTWNPTDAGATTYYFGGRITVPTTTAALWRLWIPRAGTIKAIYGHFIQTATASAGTTTLNIRLNNTTDTVVSAAIVNNAATTTFSATGLSIAVAAGDYVELKWAIGNNAWGGAPPTNVHCQGVIYVE